MALQAAFEAFLRSPSAAALAEDAAISYIPTLTTIAEPAAILKHLQAQARQLKKNKETTIDAVEGGSGLYLDVETALEFLTGGGAYLPGLDDNFLADKVATLPLSYVVRFDAQQKIRHIRVYWEQASLLKQLEVIGARGRNWPIREGKDQVRLIREHATAASSASGSGAGAGAERPGTASSRPTTSGGASNGVRSHSSSTSATRGEKTSLSLFQPHAEEDESRSYVPPGGEVVSPRLAAKPVPRDLTDILAQAQKAQEDAASMPPPQSARKGGAGKHFGASRLFGGDDADADAAVQPKPANDIKLDPRKFQHFEFGDAEDHEDGQQETAEQLAARKAAEARRKKHASQWDFADFETPDRPKLKVLPQNERTFGWSDDEDDAATSPVKRPVVHRERKDARPHFELTDEVTPVAERTQQPQQQQQQQRAHQRHGSRSNAGQGLYKDHILGTDDGDATPKRPLSTATNISHANRQRDFDAHYSVADDNNGGSGVGNGDGAVDPASATSGGSATAGAAADGTDKENSHHAAGAKGGRLNEGQKKVLSALSASWDLSDHTTADDAPREKKIYKTSGNGMGGRKDAAAHWAIGDEDFRQETPARPTGRAGSRQQASKGFWDF